MQYRHTPPLSILGFGCMRFPPSWDKTARLVARAAEAGVNYFDTAYIYPGSEDRLGRALAGARLRHQVNIATKLPLLLVRAPADLDRFLAAQLQRLRTDHIDYYLMHMLTSPAQWESLRALGVEEWIRARKAAGVIRYAGFSFHGRQADFLALLDAYPWDFCQIQYNYVDERNQAGLTGLRAAAARGLPVIVMEPLLGGRLAGGSPHGALPPAALAALNAANAAGGAAGPGAAPAGAPASPAGGPPWSPAAWALRWLWNQPEVTVVLSGMSDEAQLDDNLRAAADARPGMLDAAALAAIARARDAFTAARRVPCTGCGYCQPCPRGVNIPGCFDAYNKSHAAGRFTGLQQYITITTALSATPGTAGRCVRCGACEPHCPQSIPIRARLADTRRRLEPFWIAAALAAARAVLGVKPAAPTAGAAEADGGPTASAGAAGAGGPTASAGAASADGGPTTPSGAAGAGGPTASASAAGAGGPTASAGAAGVAP